MKSLLVAVGFLIAPVCLGVQPEAQAGGVEFSVRTVNPVELPADTSREWLQFLGPGLASGALGAVAPPMYASGLVLGGLLLAPGALILSDVEHKNWRIVADALKRVALENDLLRAVRSRAERVLPDGMGRGARAELVVHAFGIVGERPEKLCFLANVEVVGLRFGQEILRDRLAISDARRSADAPPAQCASLERFAERDGELVRDSAAECIEVLAAMAVDRLSAALDR